MSGDLFAIIPRALRWVVRPPDRESNSNTRPMTRTLLALAVVPSFLVMPAANAATKSEAPPSSSSLMRSLLRQAPGLRSEVLRLAMRAANTAGEAGLVTRRNLLTVIDYSLPSSQPRLFVFDLAARKLLFRELVAHGRSSGGDHASFFSNDPGSNASRLRLFVTSHPYVGGNSHPPRPRRLAARVNDLA